VVTEAPAGASPRGFVLRVSVHCSAWLNLSVIYRALSPKAENTAKTRVFAAGPGDWESPCRQFDSVPGHHLSALTTASGASVALSNLPLVPWWYRIWYRATSRQPAPLLAQRACGLSRYQCGTSCSARRHVVAGHGLMGTVPVRYQCLAPGLGGYGAGGMLPWCGGGVISPVGAIFWSSRAGCCGRSLRSRAPVALRTACVRPRGGCGT